MIATRLQTVMFVGVTGICAAAFVIADEPQVPDKTPASESEITELLNERVAVLQELTGDSRVAYRSGELTLEALMHAESDLLLARLELAQDGRARIEIREALVKTAQQLEEVAQRKWEAAEGTRAETLRARAFRLQAQVNLARERQAGN